MSDIEYIHCPFIFYEGWTRQDLKVFLSQVPNRSDTAIVLAYPTEPTKLYELQPELDRFFLVTRKLGRKNKIYLLLDHCAEEGEVDGIDEVFYTHWFAIDAVVRMKSGYKINLSYNPEAEKGLLLPGFLCRDHRLGLLAILEHNNFLQDKTVWSFYPSPYDDIDSMNAIWNRYYDGSGTYNDFKNKYGVREIDPMINWDITQKRQEPMIGGPGYSFPTLHFANTKVSLVTETFIDLFRGTGSGIDISEKTWSKIINNHPFIVIGQQNILTRLKELGFRTFEYDFIEPYDMMPYRGDKKELKKKMQTIVSNYGKWIDIDFSTKQKQQVSDDVTYNFFRLKTYYKEEIERIPFFRDFSWLRSFRNKFYSSDTY